MPLLLHANDAPQPPPPPPPQPQPPQPQPSPEPEPFAPAALVEVMELLSVACAGCAEDPASCEALVRLAHGQALPAAHVAWRRASVAGDAHGAAALLPSLVTLQSRLLRAPLPDLALRRALGGAQHADLTLASWP